MILCDTNILIEFYNGRDDVLEIFAAIGVSNLAISVITAGELLYGAHDKRELRRLKEHIEMIRQIPLDEEISELYLELLEKYSLSHRLTIPDAIIAATAIRYDIPLYTLNVKDFRYIAGLAIYP